MQNGIQVFKSSEQMRRDLAPLLLIRGNVALRILNMVTLTQNLVVRTLRQD